MGAHAILSKVETAKRVLDGIEIEPVVMAGAFGSAISEIVKSYPFGVRLSGLNGSILRSSLSKADSIFLSERTDIIVHGALSGMLLPYLHVLYLHVSFFRRLYLSHRPSHQLE